MNGRFPRLSQPKVQAVVVSIGIWLMLAITAWLNPGFSQTGSRILSGVILGTTASIIGHYVLSLPNNSGGYKRNVLSALCTAYALFVYCLWLLFSQQSLIVVPSLTVGQNLLLIVIASFLLGSYMGIGVLLDTFVAKNHHKWLGLLGAMCIYAWIAGMLVRGFSQDIWFLASLPIARLASSLVLGKLLANKTSNGLFLALGIRFAILNLLVLPVTAVLSR